MNLILVGCDSGQPGLVVGDPAYCRGIETRWSLQVLLNLAILWFSDLIHFNWMNQKCHKLKGFFLFCFGCFLFWFLVFGFFWPSVNHSVKIWCSEWKNISSEMSLWRKIVKYFICLMKIRITFKRKN